MSAPAPDIPSLWCVVELSPPAQWAPVRSRVLDPLAAHRHAGSVGTGPMIYRISRG